ncbi:MAG TPA: hypothetical protein VJP02_18875 [Candidatus Sulfotelmatobacter sp.]|nr:hypothetical protein [Candidatus Sulfotelmatobacter sp.]
MSLLDLVVFLQVMFGTKDLNILGVFRRTTLRVRNDVIEMQILFATTLNTAAFVALPDRQFNVGWYDSIMI